VYEPVGEAGTTQFAVISLNGFPGWSAEIHSIQPLRAGVFGPAGARPGTVEIDENKHFGIW
jgi:hypothetical protein